MTHPKHPKIAVIGCGHWGKNHLKAFSACGALAALYDASGAVAAQYAAQYNVPARSWEQILADSSIDGVVLATPAVTHAALAEQALRAGKHVLVEKPMAMNVTEAEKIIALAESCDRFLMVGHVLRYHPAFRALEQLVLDGKLGVIKNLYSHRLSLGKVRAEEDVLWSFAPHDLSMILALVGEAPKDVQSFTSAYLQKNIADTGLILLDFANGAKAHIHASWAHPFKEQRLVVVGDKAMAVFDDTQIADKKLALYEHALDANAVPPQFTKQEPHYIACDTSEPLRNEAQHFIDAIATKTKPLTDGYEGLHVLKILEQIAS